MISEGRRSQGTPNDVTNTFTRLDSGSALGSLVENRDTGEGKKTWLYAYITGPARLMTMCVVPLCTSTPTDMTATLMGKGRGGGEGMHF